MANVRWHDEADGVWLSAVGKVTTHALGGAQPYLWMATTGKHGRCNTPDVGMSAMRSIGTGAYGPHVPRR
jgi:hypothetical protein